MQYLRTSSVFIESWLKKFNPTQELKHQIVPRTPQAMKTPAKNEDPTTTKFPTFPPSNICEYSK